jgi:hypothetical protein
MNAVVERKREFEAGRASGSAKPERILMMIVGGVLLATLSSCSCGIYRKEYAPSDRRQVFTDEIVDRAARANGFRKRSFVVTGSEYQLGDFLLVHSRDGRKLRFSSLFCPAPWNLHHAGKWETECE